MVDGNIQQKNNIASTYTLTDLKEYQRLETKYRRNKRMLEMRESGLTFQAIADAFGITRQRAHKILSQMKGGDLE